MTDLSHYEGSELHLFRNAHHWKEYLRRQLSPFISGDILEVGAGLGATTLKLHRADCKSWTCLEPDEEMARGLPQATASLKDRSSRPPRIESSTLQDIGSERRFDTILYVDVLEHIENDSEELRLASEHLNPKGSIVVLSPAMPWLFSPFDKSIGHFRRYTKRSLEICAPPELSVVCNRYLDSVGVAASLFNRLLMRSSMPTESQIALWDGYMVPLSRRIDPLLGYRAGKSVLGVFRSTR